MRTSSAPALRARPAHRFRRALLIAALLDLVLPAAASATPAAGEAPALAALGTYVRGPGSLVPGTPAALRIATHWSTSATESGPQGGVAVEVRLQGNGRDAVLWHGRTTPNGVADARFVTPTWPPGTYTLTVRSQAGERHNLSAHPVALQPAGKLRLESDKPLYQPSQVIHLRALGLRAQDGRPLAEQKVRFEVKDPRGTRVLTVEKTLSRFGIAAADLPLADEISLGHYQASVVPVEDATGIEPAELSVEVSRYVLPRFKVAIEADRTWYGPGDTVRLTVEARYAFGKAIGGGTAAVDAILTSAGFESHVARLERTALGADGKATFTIPLPARTRPVEDGKLRLRIDITDRADHRETVLRELPVSSQPVRVEVVAERGKLVAGVDNRLWIVAALPDEKPVAGADVIVNVAGRMLKARTNAIGVAEVTVRPTADVARGTGDCGFGRVEVTASYHGAVHQSHRCVGWEEQRGILLRTDRAIYPMGEPLVLDIEAPGGKGVAYVDVVRADQTTDTVVVELRDGRGRITVPADARRWGTIGLDAYVIDAGGRRTHDARLVYVENPAALRVEVGAQSSYRPGETGKIQLRVVDAQTGAGRQAAIGLVMVDEALLALRPVRPAATRAFFSLAAEASKPAVAMKARPGGFTVERLVEEGARDSLRQQAARILLAGAVPAWEGMWEVDPWAMRQKAANDQDSDFAVAAPEWVKHHLAGERVPGNPGKWRWREDLVARMIEDHALPAGHARDPWEQAVTTAHVVQVARLGDYGKFAEAQLDAQVSAIYEALAWHKDELAADEAVKGRWPAVVVTMTDLEKWAHGRLTDPWGSPLRLVKWKWAVSIDHLRSRYVLASAGPDGIPGTPDDRYACDWFGSVAARPLDKAFSKRTERGYDVNGNLAVHGFGLVGTGTGGGGTGEGTIGLGTWGTWGKGGGGGPGSKEHVRRSFPETMLWQPELVTDARGNAVVDVEMADSITTWRLAAQAVADDGRLGFATADIRVFQSFFVEVDLPTAATQHDELHLPVAVYNYLPTTQHITLTLEDAAWFARTGAAEQALDVAASQVGVAYFPIRLVGAGPQKLRVRGVSSAGARDVVERTIEVVADGDERKSSFQGCLVQTGDATVAEHTLAIPANVIAGTAKVELKVYPDAAAHVVEGLESLLREPHGCFEQTSSTTYPNALVLDYLGRTGKLTPALDRQARGYLRLGYQRLLSFEVPGGGFSLFGQAPADPVLTAYGLEEFHDMARLVTVDADVIARTRAWLSARQQKDGSFAGADGDDPRSTVRTTAYIGRALAHAGGDPKAIAAARAFVERTIAKHRLADAYTLALAALFVGERKEPAERNRWLDRLWSLRRDQPNGSVSFETVGMTLMHGWGDSTEVTALAALALLAGDASPERSERAVQFLFTSKDPAGAWRSTQATILALKALLAGQPAARKQSSIVRVSVDGAEQGKVVLSPSAALLEVLDLPAATTAGNHVVALRWAGEGKLSYQLVGRWVVPRAAAAGERGGQGTSADGTLVIRRTLNKHELSLGETATVVAEVEAHGDRPLAMPIVSVGVPPGCDIDMEELEGLVGKYGVERVERREREVVFYLRELEPGTTLQLPVWLTPRFAMRAQLPPARVYEYYQPDYRAATPPTTLVVRAVAHAAAVPAP